MDRGVDGKKACINFLFAKNSSIKKNLCFLYTKEKHMSAVTRIPSKNLFVPNELGNLSVDYNGREFCILDERGDSFKVAKYYLSEELRQISPEQLGKCLEVAYLAINRVGNEFSIKLNGRQPGGGPILGSIGYWLVKSVCY